MITALFVATCIQSHGIIRGETRTPLQTTERHCKFDPPEDETPTPVRWEAGLTDDPQERVAVVREAAFLAMHAVCQAARSSVCWQVANDWWSETRSLFPPTDYNALLQPNLYWSDFDDITGTAWGRFQREACGVVLLPDEIDGKGQHSVRALLKERVVPDFRTVTRGVPWNPRTWTSSTFVDTLTTTPDGVDLFVNKHRLRIHFRYSQVPHRAGTFASSRLSGERISHEAGWTCCGSIILQQSAQKPWGTAAECKGEEFEFDIDVFPQLFVDRALFLRNEGRWISESVGLPPDDRHGAILAATWIILHEVGHIESYLAKNSLFPYGYPGLRPFPTKEDDEATCDEVASNMLRAVRLRGTEK